MRAFGALLCTASSVRTSFGATESTACAPRSIPPAVWVSAQDLPAGSGSRLKHVSPRLARLASLPPIVIVTSVVVGDTALICVGTAGLIGRFGCCGVVRMLSVVALLHVTSRKTLASNALATRCA